MKKYHIITYGCQMNVSDSERLAGTLSKTGYTQVTEEKEADIIFINSCSVRQKAIDRIWGKLRTIEARSQKESRQIIKILTGCVLPHDRSKLATRFDIFFPIKNLPKLPALLKSLSHTDNKSENYETPIEKNYNKIAKKEIPNIELKLSNKPITPISQSPSSEKHYLQTKPVYTHKFSACVPIMTGCNAHCTYCAVPYTRGNEISRMPEEIIQEIENLVTSGYKEIVLLGQIINKYMIKVDNTFFEYLDQILTKHNIDVSYIPELQETVLREKKLLKFHHLLAIIANIKGDFWLRFTSSHPKWFSQNLINTIKRHDKLVKHIHLPVQSGSNEVLKRMLRPYKVSEYKDIITYIRDRIPEASITSDVIVGFCGESQKEFEQTKELFKFAKYDMAYISQYSTRPGTTAQKNLIDDIPQATKSQREKELNIILKETALNYNKKYLNQKVEVLITDVKEKTIFGRTQANKNIKSPNTNQYNKNKIGTFTKIIVTEVTPWSLSGKLK